ncbi:MAG: nucleoside diphosphate kinase regulator [Gammaproteobacteria bacterium]
MNNRPAITVSSLDLERLERLLESQPQHAGGQSELLAAELARANVLAPASMPADVVTMNSRVRFAVQPAGREYEMTLVYPRDADGSADKVSVLAPVGAAMLGLKVGDHMSWPAPGGATIDVRIVEVLYQPERAGELHR